MRQGKGGHSVTEPSIVTDTFADGVVDIEIVGSVVRYIFSARHRIAGTETFEHIIVAKIVLPLEAAIDLNAYAREVLGIGHVMVAGGHC